MKRSPARKLDGTLIPIAKRKKRKSKIQIRDLKSNYKMYAGLDVHKETIQVAVIDETGKLQFNTKIKHTNQAIDQITAKLPKDTRYVLESSSVWYGLFRHMTDDLHLDVVLSNPYNTKVIAASLKKTDKIDAYQLANLHRGGYIATCYVPNETIIEYRDLVRHRNKLTRERTKMKNSIHGITLQMGVKLHKSGFTTIHMQELKKLGNYRIDSYLKIIEFLKQQIAEANVRIHKYVQNDLDASASHYNSRHWRILCTSHDI